MSGSGGAYGKSGYCNQGGGSGYQRSGEPGAHGEILEKELYSVTTGQNIPVFVGYSQNVNAALRSGNSSFGTLVVNGGGKGRAANRCNRYYGTQPYYYSTSNFLYSYMGGSTGKPDSQAGYVIIEW